MPHLLTDGQKLTRVEWYQEMRVRFKNWKFKLTQNCTPQSPWQQVSQVIKDRWLKSGLRGILLHHDNASSHTSLKTKSFIEKSSVQILTHLSRSPDLVPCDFFLFLTVKEKLKRKVVSCPEEAVVSAYESDIFFKKPGLVATRSDLTGCSFV